MAASMNAKCGGIAFCVIAVILGEIFVLTLDAQTKLIVYRVHFMLFIEALILISFRVSWKNLTHGWVDSERDDIAKIKKMDSAGDHTSQVKRQGTLMNIWKGVLLIYFICCQFSFLIILMFFHKDPHWLVVPAYACLGTFLQLVTGLFIFAVISKIISCLTRHNKGYAFQMKKLKPALVIVYTLSISIYGLHNASQPPDIKRVKIPITGLPEEMANTKIVQISDIHLGPTVTRGKFERIVKMVNELKPDIVVITGDLVDAPVHVLEKSIQPAESIRARYGKFYISGNHEYYTGDVDNWFAHLKTLGFYVLHNSNKKIPDLLLGKHQICLAGTDDLEGRHLYDSHGMDLPKALDSCDPNQPVILLVHQPRAAKMAIESKYRVDLILAGHTHGGQVFPLMFFAYFINPYFAGLYNVGNNRHVYISMGTQYFGIPMRIGSTMEITEIFLVRS